MRRDLFRHVKCLVLVIKAVEVFLKVFNQQGGRIRLAFCKDDWAQL